MWKKKKQNQREEQFARNRLLRFSFSFFLALYTLAGYASHTFYFNKNLIAAQKQNYELRLKQARSILMDEQSIDKENSATHYLLHFNAFMKAFVTEEQGDYAAYRKVQDAALLHFDALPDSLAFKRLAQSDAYFFSATLKAKFEEFYGAARDVNRANTLINENHRLFPNFLPNNRTRGIINVYLSTVPDNYAWVVKMLGIDGDMRQGLDLLKELAHAAQDTGYMNLFAREAAYLYSFSLMHVAKNPAKAWSETLRCTNDYTTNLTSAYFRGAMAGKLNKNETAISILERRPASDEYEQFYFLDYLLGTAKLNRLDSTSIIGLNQFYSHYKGRNYIKSCLQKMSWYYTLSGDTAKALGYQALIYDKGYKLNGDDKQATLYAAKVLPNSELLQTRLLYDGGYTKEASLVLYAVNYKRLASRQLKAEYCYRKGRILEKEGKMEDALTLYEACTLFGIDSKEYYAAYASIYLGDYYLHQGYYAKAKKFYQRALSFKSNREYKGSIEQRSKVGLSKLK
ncbi:MAG: hypothetical protein P8N47_02945 [Bacteroidia bacterium]|jgi:hypothetical protein|nr:hypothetical protein [Bacteroidia bacterium]